MHLLDVRAETGEEMNNDDEALTEQIARALYAGKQPMLAHAWENVEGHYQVPGWRDKYIDLAAAVLPIIRQAQQFAWDDGYNDGTNDAINDTVDEAPNPYLAREAR